MVYCASFFIPSIFLRSVPIRSGSRTPCFIAVGLISNNDETVFFLQGNLQAELDREKLRGVRHCCHHRSHGPARKSLAENQVSFMLLTNNDKSGCLHSAYARVDGPQKRGPKICLHADARSTLLTALRIEVSHV